MSSHKTTLKEIAQTLGVSVMSVSRALRDAPGVSESLRDKVRKTAARLDYHPDPVLGALVAYRRNKAPTRRFDQLAFLTHMETEWGWKEAPYILSFFEGAREAAARIGYSLEPFWLKKDGMTPGRAGSVLYHRGIRGVLVAPMPSAIRRARLGIGWERFAAVGLGNSLEYPGLDRVITDFHQNTQVACHYLRRMGYRNIGLGLSFIADARHQHEITNAFLGEQLRYPFSGNVPPITWRRTDMEALKQWFEAHQPDVLLTNRPGEMDQLRQSLPLEIRNNLKIYYLSLYESDPPALAGIVEPLRELGARAAELLHTSLLNGRMGVPNAPMKVRVAGRWRE